MFRKQLLFFSQYQKNTKTYKLKISHKLDSYTKRFMLQTQIKKK